VDGHPLPIEELKGIKPVESIDLSGKGLQVESAIIIGACIKGNEHLRQLEYWATSSNPQV
jgi:Ran GTPase-activating protein (RanGAP) involved in mRNA processing and transport